MIPSLLDTDILSEILKQINPVVVKKGSDYHQTWQQFSFSAITRYEIVRGLKAKSAIRQLQQFATFCQHCQILPVSEAVFDRAADLWVSAHAVGRPQKDADLLIAATALEFGFTLVTGNTADFFWIAGLSLDDWRQP